MLQHISSQQAFNNDRTAYMAAFRHPAHPSIIHSPHSNASSNPALAASAQTLAGPLPVTHDTELVEAQTALNDVRQEMHSQGAPALTQVHSGLDAERVARLLGLLE